ncbi:MAG: TRAM domain-containing protein [Chloroflexi bacterium]|nr:TRAM domain-containing protein [Chloroflexota bacterium]MBI3764130.1 TRAM domain-containing protein [Chloroflexota bacterium]
MSVEFVFRILGMIGMAIGGLYLGVLLADMAKSPPELWAIVFALVGALLGLIGTPWITTRPARYMRRLIGQMPAQLLVAAMVGVIVGLIVAALLAFPLSLLPKPFGQVLPFVGAIVFGWLGISMFVMRQRDIFSIFESRLPARGGTSGGESSAPSDNRSVLLDTSVIIDGRVADISQTGFVVGTMIVPRFVLNELQHIADSADNLRRNRGRRGLDILNRLQKDSLVPVRITDMDVEGVREVDDKLVILAKQLHCPIMTNDYNLNRVAELQGVSILNINELANAVKAVFLPGESMTVKIIQEGKEIGQGVGYLDDGTMVVVEEGRRWIDQNVDVMVTKVLQTAAGRMIFARPENMN